MGAASLISRPRGQPSVAATREPWTLDPPPSAAEPGATTGASAVNRISCDCTTRVYSMKPGCHWPWFSWCEV